MNIFDKIFARKAEEIKHRVDLGESYLNEAEARIKNLRESHKADLLREELDKLINSYAYENRKYSYTLPYSDSSSLEKYLNEIRVTLDELVLIAKGES